MHLHFTGPADYYELEVGDRGAGRRPGPGRAPPVRDPGRGRVGDRRARVRRRGRRARRAGRERRTRDRTGWSSPTGRAGPTPGWWPGSAPGRAVLGVDVGTRPDLDEVVPRLAAEAAAAHGSTGAARRRSRSTTTASAPATARSPTRASEAISLAARLEGLILDPVYTGKAMAGLVAAVREGRVRRDDTVVFWHTGGAPGPVRGPLRPLVRGPGAGVSPDGVGPAAAGPTSEQDDQVSRSLRATATPTESRIKSNSSFFMVTPGFGEGRMYLRLSPRPDGLPLRSGPGERRGGPAAAPVRGARSVRARRPGSGSW